MPDPLDDLKRSIESDDNAAIETRLSDHRELCERLNEGIFPYGMPAMAAAQSVEVVQTLKRFGATYATVESWWKPGFAVRKMKPEVGRFIADQGAELSPHAASALGFVDSLAAMIDNDPQVVDAKGGDDATPLHFARDIATAKLLVERGAKLDARDGDHDSTPTQWLIGDAPEVAKFLIQQGAKPDIFVAAALGDQSLVERVIADEPDCLSLRIGKSPVHPIGYNDLGGTILQWTLGFNSYAHQIAAKKGHRQLFEWMFERSDTTTKFLVACLMSMRDDAETMARENPNLVESLEDVDKELLARYCWETNVDISAVTLMLDLGFPINHPETSHAYAPLHNAAWGGYGDLVDLLIARGASLDLKDPTFGSTPLGFAIYCCVEDGRHPDGEYGRVVSALLEAGSPWDVADYPTGSQEIDDVLRPRLRDSLSGLAALGDLEGVRQWVGSKAPAASELTLALVCAAKAGQTELCGYLLDAGAEQVKPDEHYWAPLHAAVAGHSTETVELLLQRGADTSALNSRGGTAWHTLGGMGCDDEMIDLLAKHDGFERLNQESHHGLTALDVAYFCGKEETARRLERRGAVAREYGPNPTKRQGD